MAAAADKGHAEQVALDYATAQADMDFHDLGPGVPIDQGHDTGAFERLTQAATSMEADHHTAAMVAKSTPIAARSVRIQRYLLG